MGHWAWRLTPVQTGTHHPVALRLASAQLLSLPLEDALSLTRTSSPLEGGFLFPLSVLPNRPRQTFAAFPPAQEGPPTARPVASVLYEYQRPLHGTFQAQDAIGFFDRIEKRLSRQIFRAIE